MKLIEVNEGVFINEDEIRRVNKREDGNYVYTRDGEYAVSDTVFSFLTESAKDKATKQREREACKAAKLAEQEVKKSERERKRIERALRMADAIASRKAKKESVLAEREARKAAKLAKKAAFVPYAEKKRLAYEKLKAWMATQTTEQEATVNGWMHLAGVEGIKDNVMGAMIEAAPIPKLYRRKVPGRWYVYILKP